jgi:hypothetical protein
MSIVRLFMCMFACVWAYGLWAWPVAKCAYLSSLASQNPVLGADFPRKNVLNQPSVRATLVQYVYVKLIESVQCTVRYNALIVRLLPHRIEDM